MKTILVFSNAFILVLISLLHFYWAAGGKWAYDGAIPEQFKSTAQNVQYRGPTILATLFVAIGLLVFAAVVFSNHFDIDPVNRFNQTNLFTRIIGGIFLVRAIGDFSMVGVFKKQDGSLFAQRDSKIYIPLCLFLGISAIAVTLL